MPVYQKNFTKNYFMHHRVFFHLSRRPGRRYLSHLSFPSPTHHPPLWLLPHWIWRQLKNSVPSQRFRFYNSTPLDGLPTLICARSREWYLLWSEIQNAFTGINHLMESLWGPRIPSWSMKTTKCMCRNPRALIELFTSRCSELAPIHITFFLRFLSLRVEQGRFSNTSHFMTAFRGLN